MTVRRALNGIFLKIRISVQKELNFKKMSYSNTLNAVLKWKKTYLFDGN